MREPPPLARGPLLEALTRLTSDADADADTDILQTFLPLPRLADVLAPTKLVVRGGRGTGKTAIFRVLRALGDDPDGLRELLRAQGDLLLRGVDPGVRWVEGFSERGTRHPTPDVLGAWAAPAEEDRTLRAFWLGHLVGTLSEAGEAPADGRAAGDDAGPVDTFLGEWRRARTDPARWISAAMGALAPLTAWLDRLDERLGGEARRVVVAYDNLDKLGLTDGRARERLVSALLALWLSISSRYERLHGKVFVREDLFQRSLVGSPDASKLEGRSTRLLWTSADLYRVLVRHMAAHEELRRWLRETPPPYPLEERGKLGWFPPDYLPDTGPGSARELVRKLVGEIMGSGVRKGYTHRWIPNHLQDANKQLVPRSILNLVAFAARSSLRRDGGGAAASGSSTLLRPQDLRAGLEGASKQRVRELAEEVPVARRLEHLRGLVLFAPKRDVVELLARGPVGSGDGFGSQGDRVFQELEELGVFSVRDDGRVDMPDLYRFGFGIKRRGGVARPR